MNDKTKKQIWIECGLKGETARKETYLFWPIMEVLPLPVVWQPLTQKEFSISFTSKQAVKIFLNYYNNTLHAEYFLKCCQYVGAVGDSTAAFIQKHFPNNLKNLTENIVYPTHELGLQSLLMQFNHLIGNQTQLFIFTALQGKTQKIISDNINNLQFNPVSIPLYETKELDCQNCMNFFKNIYMHNANKEAEFVFFVRSGQVLINLVKILNCYFAITDASNLPSSILFAPWERSAKKVLKELKLIDRDIS